MVALVRDDPATPPATKREPQDAIFTAKPGRKGPDDALILPTAYAKGWIRSLISVLEF